MSDNEGCWHSAERASLSTRMELFFFLCVWLERVGGRRPRQRTWVNLICEHVIRASGEVAESVECRPHTREITSSVPSVNQTNEL